MQNLCAPRCKRLMKVGKSIFFDMLVSQLRLIDLFHQTGSYCGIKHLFACSSQMRIILDLFKDNRNPSERGGYLSIRSADHSVGRR